jgi:hypothetical protein
MNVDNKDNILLIEHGLSNLQFVLQILRNVYANPHVIQEPEELKSLKLNPDTKIIASTLAISKVIAEGYQCYSLITPTENVIRFVGSLPDRREGVFSEEFVVSTLLQKSKTV